MRSKTLSYLLCRLFATGFIEEVVAQHYSITGVFTGIDPKTGERPTRRDILDLQNDLPQLCVK